MATTTRRAALAASIAAGASLSLPGSAKQDDDKLTKDQAFAVAAGMTKQEAKIWNKVAEVAGDFFKLPELHPLDNQEVASAIHIIQNKLLSRPTYRKYLEMAKAAHPKDK